MNREIKIIENDGCEHNIDEIDSITIKNKLRMNFEFKTDNIKSIELVEVPLTT